MRNLHYLFKDNDMTMPLSILTRERYLAWLLNGLNQEDDEIRQKMTENELDFTPEGFLVIGAEIAEDTEMDFIRLLINRWEFQKIGAMTEVFGRYYMVFSTLPEERLPGKTELAGCRAIILMTEIMDVMQSEYGLTMSVVISGQHSGFRALPDAYQEVNGLFEYKTITGNQSRMLQYTDYFVSFDSWYSFGTTYSKFEESRKFIISVQVGDFVSAKSIILSLINTDYSLEYPSLELAKCRLYGIIDSALNALGLLRTEVEESFLRELDAATRIVRCRTYAQIEAELSAIFDSIIEYFSSKNKDKPPAWFDETIAYIKKHFNDPEMNVSMIAGYFQINAAYYARIFKRYMGVAPLDYIHKLRMESAKELMAKGVSVKDTASIVGYYNTLTMSRAFKRYEGITPGKYIQNRLDEDA